MPKKTKRTKAAKRRQLVRTPRPIALLSKRHRSDSKTTVGAWRRQVRHNEAAKLNNKLAGIDGDDRKAATEFWESGTVQKLGLDGTKRLLEDDEDFINAKRFDYSLKKLLERYPTGCSERIAASVLMLTEEELRALYEKIVLKLRFFMQVTI